MPFKNFTTRHYLLIGFILLLNLVQAFFTGLHVDEGYYWIYSQHPAWGYYDHPPMIALLIRLGDLISHSPLGIRLIPVLLSTITTILIMKETGEKKDVWFLGLFLLSFPLFHTHIGGFMALPDVPLVFFTLLFFLVYRNFLEKPDTRKSLLLALIAAAMIYSKYHAFLVLGLIILSNLKLLKNKYFWLIVLVAVILLIPHFSWQLEHGFPSLQYNLQDRIKPFRFKYVIHNIVSQVAVLGPLTFFLIIQGLARFKVRQSLFNRSILFNILGFYIFFFLVSFKNRIEAHWTVVIIPLVMIVTYPEIAGHPKIKKRFKQLAFITVILLLGCRFYIAADFIPNIGHLKSAFYRRAATYQQIKKMANGLQVASFNNYSFPGIYEFYTGDKVVYLASPIYRRCQFDLIRDQHRYDGDSLFAILPKGMKPDQTNLIQLVSHKKIDTLTIAGFYSLKELQLTIEGTERNSSVLKIRVKLDNQSGKTIFLKHQSKPSICLMQNKKELTAIPLDHYKTEIRDAESFSIEISIPVADLMPKQKLLIYTRTKEMNRGEMIVLDQF